MGNIRRIFVSAGEHLDMTAALIRLIAHRQRVCRALIIQSKPAMVRGCGAPAIGASIFRDDDGRVATIPMCAGHINSDEINLIAKKSVDKRKSI